MRAYFLFCILFIFLGSSCVKKDALQKVLRSKPILKEVVKNKYKYRLQLIYTKISRDSLNNPSYKHYSFNVDSNLYFYPASTAKLFASVYAMEIIHKELKDSISIETPLKAFANGQCQTDELYDSLAYDYKPSLSNYIKRMLLVSDNLAYNRVFDFIGQDYFQRESRRLGFKQTIINQRFDWRCTTEDNRFHNAFTFYSNDSTVKLRTQAITTEEYVNPVRDVTIGKGFYINDSLTGKPKQFRFNNNIPLKDLNSLLEKIMNVNDSSLRLSLDDRKFLWEYLSKYPNESAYPAYDTSYYTLYKKYLYYGGERGINPDSNIRSFNIVGQAYGFTTDAAYIVDFKNKIEFILSATIYTNENEILNDGKYEYAQVAMPFLKTLGEQIYKQELKTKPKENRYIELLFNSIPYLKINH
jgi:hypothetical protein